MTDEPVSRPLSTGRRGVQLGDGAAIVLLEAEGALDGRAPVARITGWGRAGDGFDAVRPEPNGRGMVEAIGRALKRAGLEADAVGHVSVHGTGTVLNDAAEGAALASVFGADAIAPTHASKASTGHMLEATGLVEAALAVQAVRTGIIAPTATLRDEDVPLFRGVLTVCAKTEVEHALTLNLAFGGCNTAIVISRWRPDARDDAEESDAGRVRGRMRRVAEAAAPERPTPLPGFIESGFPPAVYAAADACLERAGLPHPRLAGTVVLLLAPDGDRETRDAVQRRIDHGLRIPPPFLMQSTPPSVIGRLAARWGLRGGITVLASEAGFDEVDAIAAEFATTDDAEAVLVIRAVRAAAGGPVSAQAALFTTEPHT
jgi:hypothetical protein